MEPRKLISASILPTHECFVSVSSLLEQELACSLQRKLLGTKDTSEYPKERMRKTFLYGRSLHLSLLECKVAFGFLCNNEYNSEQTLSDQLCNSVLNLLAVTSIIHYRKKQPNRHTL